MAAGAAQPLNRVAITAGICLASLIQALDTTIANVALPYMRASLSATLEEIDWVLTAYITASAIMTPPTGWLAARFGRRNLLLASVTGFTLASILCGLAQTLDEMVVFRILQGIGGAALIPLAQAVILDIYAPEEQGQAMSWWGLGVLVGPVIGPTLGGWITENYDWRWVFFINVPIGAVCLLLLAFFLPDGARKRDTQFDWIGFATLSLFIGGLQMTLDRGQEKDWFGSTEIVVEATLTALGIYLFVVHTMTTRKPFFDLSLLKDRNYIGGLLFIFVLSWIITAVNALLAPFFQDLAGDPVETTGLLLMPRGVGMMLVMLLVGRVVGRVDARLICAIGFLMMAFSLWQMTGWTADISQSDVVMSSLVQGMGMGASYISLQSVIFSTLPAHLRSEATAFFGLLRNMGQSVGISVVSVLLTRNTQANHAAIAAFVTPFNHALRTGAAHLYWNLHSLAGRAALDAEITRQASIIGYIDNFKLMLIGTLLALPIVFLVRVTRKTAPANPHEVVLE